jgi:hypothetical protein
MANVVGPFGMKPIRYKSGAPYNGACNPYWTTANLFIGDPVVITTSAMSADYFDFPAGSLRTVTNASAGSTSTYYITGAVVGVFPEQATSPVYNPTSTNRIVYVADDPNLVFAIQDDGSATPTYALAGHNSYLVSGSGNTYTNLSGYSMSATGAATGNTTYQLRILGLRPIVGNSMGTYAQWEVAINNHTDVNNFAGV